MLNDIRTFFNNIYANDVQLYTSTRKENIDSCLHSIIYNLDEIDSWSSANGLCTIPSRNNVTFVIPALSIKEIKINFVKSETNLSSVFNDSLAT